MKFSAHLPAAAVMALALAGCSGSVLDHEARAPGGAFNPGAWSSREARMSGDPGSAPAMAAVPAAAGRVVAVRERRLANGARQSITLAGDGGVRGENSIEVVLRADSEGNATQNLVEMPGENANDIEAELERRFPGMAMRVHDYVLRNAYGPYGLASGSSGRVSCVYMWQTISNLDGGVRREHIVVQPTEAAVRVRLCRVGVSVSQLAQWAGAVVVDPSGARYAGQTSPSFDGGGDALADARGEGGARTIDRGFAGYVAPPAETLPERRAAAPYRAARSARYAHAPRYARRHVSRVRPALARQDDAAQRGDVQQAQGYAPGQGYAPQGQGYAPQGYVQQPAPGYAPVYGQPAYGAPPAYAPAQPIWTQPGAAALTQQVGYPASAGFTPSNGASAAAPLGLPPQAFGGPAGARRAPVAR